MKILLALAPALCASAQQPGLSPPLDLVTYLEDPKALAQMGAALKTQGNYLFIGAPGDGKGRVDVRFRVPRGYIIVQRLTIPAGLAASCNQFGMSLAADGSALVVGTRMGGSGRVVVYRRSATDFLYHEEAVLEPHEHESGSLFGEHVAVLDGELIAVTARGAFAVHVFEADEDGRFPTKPTRTLDPVSVGAVPADTWKHGFGCDVELHRSTYGVSLLVGMRDACFYRRPKQEPAPDETTPNAIGATAARTGAVAVLRRIDGEWSLVQRLIPDWSKVKDFGVEITVDGPHVGVGATYSNVFSGGLQAGTASVYRFDGALFSLVKTVWPSGPAANGLFGSAVEFCGDYLLVGQPYSWGGPQGLVEVFKVESEDVTRVGVLTAPDGNGARSADSLGDRFGLAIACNAFGEAIVAAPLSAPSVGAGKYAGGEIYLWR